MEDQLMLIYNGIVISWFAVFVSIGCFTAVVVSCILRLFQKKSVSDVFTVTMFAIPLGLLFGRILYCLFSNDILTSLSEYINLTNGGYGLFGVILGVFFAALIASRLFHCGELGELLDCIVPGGTLAITIGRFATRFTSSEIGYPVNFKLFTVYDAKENVYNLAIFDLDGIFEAIIFIICLFAFFYTRRIKGTSGITSLIMLALHGTNQVVMDSMRADPLMLGINNFIKISQIIGILCCISVLVYLMVVTAKKDRFSRFHIISIPIILVSIVLGVLGEYRVGSTNYISKHLLMLFGMLMLDWLTLIFAFKSIALTKAQTVEASDRKPLPAESELTDNSERMPYVRYGRASNFRTAAQHNAPAQHILSDDHVFENNVETPVHNREFKRHQRTTSKNPRIDYESLKHELDEFNM